MKKLLSIIVLCTLCFSFMPVNLFAASFGSSVDEAVEDSENNKSSKKDKKLKKEEKSSSSDNETDDATIELIFYALCGWFIVNGVVTYEDYPYCEEDERAIHYKDQGETFEFLKSEGLNLSRAILGTNTYWMYDVGYGQDTYLDLMLCPWFGLYSDLDLRSGLCENLYSDNNIKNLDDKAYGSIKAGAQLPIFQTNILSVYTLWMYSKYFGNSSSELKKSGFCGGLDFKSYPCKPVTLELKLYADNHGDLNLTHSDFSVGFAVKRAELVASWKYMSLSYDTDDDNDDFNAEFVDDWNGLSLGVKINF